MNHQAVLASLTGIKEFLKSIIEICKSIMVLIFDNKFLLLLLLLIYLGYLGLNYLAYEMPKRIITNYYHAIDNKQLNEAWNMMSPQCQVRWDSGCSDFEKGYATLATTKIQSIDNSNAGNLFEALSSDREQFIVNIIVIENFTYNNLMYKDSIVNSQYENSHWLRLRHKEHLNVLEANKLSPYKSALKLVRRYKKVFTIQKIYNSDLIDRLCSYNWLITDIDNKEIGIIYDTTFL